MILTAIAAFFATAPRLYAGATVNVAKFVTPAEMRSGSLLLKSEGDRFVEAPLVATDADIVVSGPTTRGRITQIFHNPTDGWVEGIYVYPLSEGSAVDTLKMVIGERIVVGDIEDRKKARELYRQEVLKLLDQISKQYPPGTPALFAPDIKFHRAIGEFAGETWSVTGEKMTPEAYAKHLAEMLPNEEEKKFVSDLMREPDWMAPREQVTAAGALAS